MNSLKEVVPREVHILSSAALPNPYFYLMQRISGSPLEMTWVVMRPKVQKAVKSWLMALLKDLDWLEIYTALNISFLGKGIDLRREEIKTMIKIIS